MSEFHVTPNKSFMPEKAGDNALVPRTNGEISVGRLTDRYDEHGRRVVSIYDETTGSYSKEKPLASATLSETRQQDLAEALAADLKRDLDEDTLPRGLGGVAAGSLESPASSGIESGVGADEIEVDEKLRQQRLTHVLDSLYRRANHVHHEGFEQADSNRSKYIQLDGAARQVVEDVVRDKNRLSLADSTEILGIAVGMTSQPVERDALHRLLASELNVDISDLNELFMRTDSELSWLDDRGTLAQIEGLEAWRQRLVKEGRVSEPLTSLVSAARLGAALKISAGSTRSRLVSSLSEDFIK